MIKKGSYQKDVAMTQVILNLFYVFILNFNKKKKDMP